MADSREWGGQLGRVPFPEILGELRRDRSSGTLFCVRGSTSRLVRLAQGTPVWVSSNDPDESLEAYRFRRGKCGIDDPPAGAEPELEREHALDLALDLFTWSDGAFLWVAGEPTGDHGRTLGIPFATVIARGLDRVTRVGAVRAGAGALDLALEAIAEPDPAVVRELSDEACLVLGALRAGSPLADDDTPWPGAYRALLSLWQLRLLGLVRPSQAADAVTVSALLGGGKAAAPASRPGVPEATAPAAAVVPTAPTLPPPVAGPATAAAPGPRPRPIAPDDVTVLHDVPPVSPAALARPVVERAVTVSRLEAPLAPRRGPVVTGLDPSELASRSQSTRTPQELAAEWFKNGERFLREMDLHNAVTSFREAVALCGENPEYLHRLGTTLARNPKWRKEAEEHLIRATELLPWDAKNHLALGKLYAEAGLARRAEVALKAAIEADPGNPLARKELAELQKKQRKTTGVLAGAVPGSGLLGRLARIGRDPADAPAGAGQHSESLEDSSIEV